MNRLQRLPDPLLPRLLLLLNLSKNQQGTKINDRVQLQVRKPPSLRLRKTRRRRICLRLERPIVERRSIWGKPGSVETLITITARMAKILATSSRTVPQRRCMLHPAGAHPFHICLGDQNSSDLKMITGVCVPDPTVLALCPT